jgi:hypothetical protein
MLGELKDISLINENKINCPAVLAVLPFMFITGGPLHRGDYKSCNFRDIRCFKIIVKIKISYFGNTFYRKTNSEQGF